MKTLKREIKPSIYSISYQDMLDVWIESFHPADHIVVVWDAKNHLQTLRNSGFSLNEAALFDNKILTIVLDDVRDCFYVSDVVSSYDEHPYIQIYSEGKLLTDNIDDLREEITT